MKPVKSADGNIGPAIHDPFTGLWSEFFQPPFPSFLPGPASFGANWPERMRVKAPVVDVSEDEKEILVKAEIAGLSEKDIELSWLDGVLYIKGEKKEEKEERSRKNTWHRESWQGSFTRGIPLGTGADFAKATAEYRNGVVTVRIPKARSGAARANTIAIEGGKP
jgi:HSP20 family protein